MSYWSGPKLDKSVSKYQQYGLVYYRIANKYCTGTVQLQGAHITEWAPNRHSSVLWMSEQSDFAPGLPFRGGIPICFPYFGKGINDDREPLHGPVRIAEWRLVQAVKTQSDTTQMVFAYDEPGGQYTLRYTVVFGKNLLTKLQITNTSSQVFHCEGVYHNYFAVGNANNTIIHGLQGDPYLDRVTGESVTGDLQPICFGDEVNRLYSTRSSATIRDITNNRRITIFSEGTGSVCVWNPGPEKSFHDITPNGWEKFVCVEPGKARDKALAINSQVTACLTQTIAVE